MRKLRELCLCSRGCHQGDDSEKEESASEETGDEPCHPRSSHRVLLSRLNSYVDCKRNAGREARTSRCLFELQEPEEPTAGLTLLREKIAE
jgi:hypothetical protein